MANVEVHRKVGKAAVLPTAPAFSFGKRLSKHSGEGGPGPGQYKTSENVLQSIDFQCHACEGDSRNRNSYEGSRDGSEFQFSRPHSVQDSRLRDTTSPRYGVMKQFEGLKPYGSNNFVHPHGSPSVHDSNVWDPPQIRIPAPAWSRNSVSPRDGSRSPGAVSASSRRSCTSLRSLIPSRGPVEYGACGPLIRYAAGHENNSLYRSIPAFSFSQDPHGRAIVAQGQPLRCRSVLNGRGIPKENPGPGAYEPADPSLNTKPQYSICGSNVSGAAASSDSSGPKPRASGIPGPGQYEPTMADKFTKRRSTASTFGSRLPPTGIGGGVITSSVGKYRPGPGQYSPQVDIRNQGTYAKGVTIKFRHQGKGTSTSSESTPAPHDYGDKDFYGRGTIFGESHKGAGFTILGRWKEGKKRSQVPGPQYAIGCSTLGMAAISDFESPERAKQTSVL